MASPSKGTGYAGELGRRLQRLFGFDGEPNASFDTKAIPVVIMGDAVLPGYGEQQGRRFGAVEITVAGNASYWNPTADIIVEKVLVSRGAIGTEELQVEAYMGILSAAVPAWSNRGIFLDRPVTNKDGPPLQSGVLAGIGIPSTLVRRTRMAILDSFIDLNMIPFCMQPGQLFQVTNGGAVDLLNVTLYGRTL